MALLVTVSLVIFALTKPLSGSHCLFSSARQRRSQNLIPTKSKEQSKLKEWAVCNQNRYSKDLSGVGS